MLNLKKNKDNVLTLLGGLKLLRCKDKSLSGKLSQKKDLKSLDQQREHLENQLERILGEIEAEEKHAVTFEEKNSFLR